MLLIGDFSGDDSFPGTDRDDCFQINTKSLDDATPMKMTYNALRVTGLMNKRGRPWSLIIAVYQNGMLILVLLSMALEAILAEVSMMYRVSSMFGVLIILHIFTKNINILLHQSEIKDLLERIEMMRLEALKDKLSRKYILQADKTARKFNKILTFGSMLYVPMGYIFSIINFYFSSSPTGQLMIPVWVPWEHKTFGPFVAAQTVVMIMSLSSTSAVVVLYIFLSNITIGLTALIKGLQSALETKQINRNTYLLHVNIIRLINDCNKLLSGQLYFELFIWTFSPCGFGYLTVELLRRNDPLFSDALYKFLLALIYPFILCSCGQQISIELEKLHECAYMGPWVESTPDVRKNLLLLMTITTNAQSLNYKNFATFTLPAFSKVIQGTYSYLTIMINVESSH